MSKTPDSQHRSLLTYPGFLSSLLTHSTLLSCCRGKKRQNKTTIQYTWVPEYLSTAWGRPKIENMTQHKTLSWNGTFLAWFSHPCQFHFLLMQDFRQTWLHLNIWGFIFFKVSRAHVGRNPKKLQQLVCEKSFPLRGPHVLAKQLITNCGTEMLSGSRAGGNLVLRSLP